MVLGSPLQGAPTANGAISSQGSKLSQMKDSFQKQMQRDKEKARVTPTAPRLTTAAPRTTANGGTAPRPAANGGTKPTRPPASALKVTKAADEDRRPLKSTPSPASSAQPRARPVSEVSSPKKSPATTPLKTSQASSTSARPRLTPSKSPSTPAASSTPTARAPAAMKKAPPSSGSSDLPQCSNCGRHFAADRLALHQTICVKTTKKKRKVFDPTKMRVKGTEAEAYLRHSAASKANKAPPATKSDWRRKHEDFIRSIRDAKAAQAYVAAGGKLSDLPPPPPMDTSDLIPCPHCGRKFNDAAAERHIPRCKDIVNKPKPPPTRPGTSGAIPKGRGLRR
ncbi:zinc finger C2HC domain-containing protein 1C-like [Hetaerina americana]|uniref:zinc finger C2HC domain-containing protein 1C-like n=1 Tax=Hetaerina americana TaxID=62018 RepID=UPI003A7F1DFA